MKKILYKIITLVTTLGSAISENTSGKDKLHNNNNNYNNYTSLCNNYNTACQQHLSHFDIDHQNLTFTRLQRVIQIKNFNPENCSVFQVRLLRHCYAEVINSWLINGTTKLVLSTGEFLYEEDQVYLNISAISGAQLQAAKYCEYNLNIYFDSQSECVYYTM